MMWTRSGIRASPDSQRMAGLGLYQRWFLELYQLGLWGILTLLKLTNRMSDAWCSMTHSIMLDTFHLIYFYKILLSLIMFIRSTVLKVSRQWGRIPSTVLPGHTIPMFVILGLSVLQTTDSYKVSRSTSHILKPLVSVWTSGFSLPPPFLSFPLIQFLPAGELLLLRKFWKQNKSLEDAALLC